MGKKSKILIGILVILIVVMGAFCYYIYVGSVNKDKEILNLKNDLNTMKENIKKIEENTKQIDNNENNILNNINQNTVSPTSQNINTNEINNVDNNSTKQFSENEIKQTLQNYLDLIGAKASTPFNLILKLGLSDSSEYDSRNLGADNFFSTKIKYTDFKSKMLEYMTEDVFNKFVNNVYDFKEKDGYLYVFDGGGTGMVFEVTDIVLKGDYSDDAYIADVYSINLDESKDLEKIEFHVANSNGKCVISYCD